MAKIAIDTTSCVRFRSLKSECSACFDACNDEAISFEEGGIRVANAKCTECFACIGVCPSSAVVSSSADVLGFVARFLDSSDTYLSCDTCGFCLLAFDAQILLTMLALRRSDISMVANGCSKCADNNGFGELLDSVNAYAEGFGFVGRYVQNSGSEQKVKNTPSVDRRGFFGALSGKNIIKAAKSINDASKDDSFFGLDGIDFEMLKQKRLPTVREGLLGVVDASRTAEAALTPLFFTDKMIDESCNNCELCYNLCPTGALSVARLKNAISFESYKCIMCKLCEDVCETKSIHSMPTVSLRNFASKNKNELIKFKVTRCYSCGTLFTVDENSNGACPRCAKEDEDAMDLSGLF